MLSTSSGGGSYHRLDAGTSTTGSAHTASVASSALSSDPSTSNFPRTGPLIAPATSSPFPIAPAPMPVPQHVMQPAPMVPYPQQTAPMHMPAGPQASQSQIICSGCRTLLVYPNNASNVRCALCSTVTPVPPAGTEMAQLVCGGCRTLLMYIRGASSVQCSCCHTVNLAMETNQVAHINCGGCGMTLMYAYGAQSVKCAVCQFVTNVAVGGAARMPLPLQRPPYPQTHPPPQQPALPQMSNSRQQTVVVENPMTMDESGKLVSNVAVGVSSEKKT